MILFGDYHTHTTYSRGNHGKGSVLDNAIVAKNKGLKEIAITDHGFNHRFYGVRRSDLDKIRMDIEKAKQETGINILLGIESNIISRDGSIDVLPSDYEKLDIVLCGYHNFVKYKSLGDKFALFYKSLVDTIFKPSLKTIDKNTAVYLRALEKNNIDVITHLNSGMITNTLEVAKAAKATGTYIELNERRMNFTDSEIVKMAEENVKFIINSDAHSPENVGECNNPLNVIARLEIPQILLCNIEQIPNFKKSR